MTPDASATAPGPVRLSSLTWGFVAVGIALRIAYYLLDFPIWWDEAFVAVNLLRRGYLDLLRPLDYGQVCPILFLWAELASVRCLGFSEWSLRLFPVACSIGGMVLFRSVAGRLARGLPLLMAVAVWAVSGHPIRHAADVKPYASDALASLALLAPALGWLGARGRAGPLWCLATVAPLAILGSHPAVFVSVGIGFSLAYPCWKAGRVEVRAAYVAFLTSSTVTFVGAYVIFARDQASATSPGMTAMWWRSFPPLDSPVALIRWLATVHSGEMLAYPLGGERGGSLASLALCAIGVGCLWNRGERAAVGCLVGPLGVALVAASLGKYPYGGPAPHGSAARIMQYAAPALCLLIGVGAGALIEHVRRPRARLWLLRLTLIGLVGVGTAPIVAGFRRPYRAYQAEASRRFARAFWPEVSRGAEVACLRGDLHVAEWDSIRLGVAVMLADEAIYSPAWRRGGPDLARVGPDRPLRCVLGMAGSADEVRLRAWLASVQGRYALRDRRTIELNTAEPGRRPAFERYEILDLIPVGHASPLPGRSR